MDGAPALPQSPFKRLRRRFGALVRDAGWALGGDLAGVVSSLATFYVVSTELGPSDYGLYAGIVALIAILATLSAAWVVLYLLEETLLRGRPMQDVFPVALSTALGGGALTTLAALLIGAALLPQAPLWLIATFAVAELIAAAPVYVCSGSIQAERGFAAAAPFRIAFTAVRAVLIGGLWLADAVSLTSVAVALLVVNVVTAATLLGYTTRHLSVSARWVMPRWRDIGRGAPYAGILVAFGVQEEADKTLMVRLSTTVDAGIYAAGYRAVQFASLPIKAIVAASHNRFLDHDPLARGQHLRRSVRFTALAVAYAVPVVVVLFFAAPLISTVLGGQYEESATVIRFVAALVLLRSLSLFAFNGLMGLQRNGARLLILTLSAVVNLVLSVALIPQYSWRGAAGATIASETLFVALTWGALVSAQRRHDRQLAEAAPSSG